MIKLMNGKNKVLIRTLLSLHLPQVHLKLRFFNRKRRIYITGSRLGFLKLSIKAFLISRIATHYAKLTETKQLRGTKPKRFNPFKCKSNMISKKC